MVRVNASISHEPTCPYRVHSPLSAAGYHERVTEENKSKLLPFPLMDSAERDLRMAAARTRFEAARSLYGYEASRSMSPPRLELTDGGEYRVVECLRPPPKECPSDGGGGEAPMPSPTREPEQEPGDGCGGELPMPSPPTELELEEGPGDGGGGEAPMPPPPTELEGPSDGGGGEGGGDETGGGGGEGGDKGKLAVANHCQVEAERRRQHVAIVYAEHRELATVAFRGGVAALKRLCTANRLLDTGSKGELLNRLVNAKVHGRPDFCRLCFEKRGDVRYLHLECTPDDLQPNEVSRIVCRGQSCSCSKDLSFASCVADEVSRKGFVYPEQLELAVARVRRAWVKHRWHGDITRSTSPMLDPLSGDPLVIDSMEGDLAAARARKQHLKWMAPPASLGILGGGFFDFEVDCNANDAADAVEGGCSGTTGGGGNEANVGEGSEECTRGERPVGECAELKEGGSGDADGGKGTAIEMRAQTGGSSDVGDDASWAPKTVEELLYAIANFDYGVSDDRSSALAVPAIKAHNAEIRKANAQTDVEMAACSDAQTLAAIEAYNAKVAACAIKAYNAKAGMYAQVVQKRGQPLREGFTIVKVRAARVAQP